MLSTIETFPICALLFFSTLVLSGKTENVTNDKQSIQALDHNLPSGTVNGGPLVGVEINKRMKYIDQHQTNGKEVEEMELKDEPWTYKKSGYEPELKKQLPTKINESSPSTNKEENSVTFVGLELKNQEKRHEAEVNNQQSVQLQDSQKQEYKDQLPTNLNKSKKTFQNSIQINMHEDCEHGIDGSLPLMWTRIQTRQTRSKQGPILGFRKGSIRFPRMPSCLSKTSSYLGKRLNARKSKKFPSQETESSGPSTEEKTLTAESKSDAPLNHWHQRPEPLVPVRKDSEPFCLPDNIKEIVMIPGSGEFVYDTIIQKKTTVIKRNDEIVSYGLTESINEHNIDKISDARVSLNNLQEDLPNVEWVSVVVNWFADSVNIGDAEIYPAVEFRDGFTVTPEDWQVGRTKRQNARLITRDNDGNPRYGGTVSDGALRRYIKELHRRGYKVMLYPMLVLDTEEKQWRGRLTGPSHEIRRFFHDKYRRFILHYSTIAKVTKTEGFIIGSEFVGLTKIQDYQGNYPAVSQLVGLAKEVKTYLDKSVIVTYAADWTEYHISSNGRYPLDELWSSEYIDVVGINAYFPLTDDPEPRYGWSVDDIVLSWTTGEGYYYYYDYSKKKPEMKMFTGGKDSKWAWKNIEKWWSEHHFNPDGSITQWRPKMKKIWFTEYGFPSVDACTNEPYIFVGATDSKFPRYSTKVSWFSSQATAIAGTIKKWRDSEMVEKMFLYAWDARPFPDFPNLREVWGDGANWQFGHWIQGKIGKVRGDKEDCMSAPASLSSPKRKWKT